MSNDLVQDVVPSTFGNWKTNILRYLFSIPQDEIQRPISEMKNEVKTAGYKELLGFQIGMDYQNGTKDLDRFFDCALYWLGIFPSHGLFLSTEDQTVRDLARERFGKRLFYFESDISGRVGYHPDRYQGMGFLEKDFDRQRGKKDIFRYFRRYLGVGDAGGDYLEHHDGSF